MFNGIFQSTEINVPAISYINKSSILNLTFRGHFSSLSPNEITLRTSGSFKKRKGRAQNEIEEGFRELRHQLKDTHDRKCKIEVLRKRSMWRRTIGYPLMMVLITALTAVSLISVVKNVGQIVAGFKSLPAANQVL